MPPIGPFNEMDRDRLCEIDALVGVIDDDAEGGGSSAPRRSAGGQQEGEPEPDRASIDSGNETAAGATGVRFALGVRFIISRDSIPEKLTYISLRKGKETRNEEAQQN